MAFDDYATAAKFKDVVKGIVREVLDEDRPGEKYAIVTGIDLNNRYDNGERKIVVWVRYVEDDPMSPPVAVSCGSVVPTAIGQTVIVGGPRSARRVVAVLGDSTTQRAPVARFKMLINGNGSIPSDTWTTVGTGGPGAMQDPYGLLRLGVVDPSILDVGTKASGYWLVGFDVWMTVDPAEDWSVQALGAGVDANVVEAGPLSTVGMAYMPDPDVDQYPPQWSPQLLPVYDGTVRLQVMHGDVGHTRSFSIFGTMWGVRIDDYRWG